MPKIESKNSAPVNIKFAVGEALRQCHGLAFWDSKLYTNTLGAALQP